MYIGNITDKGCCKTIGTDILDVSGATGHVDLGIGAKASLAINAVNKYDFVFLHVKGTDEVFHDRNFNAKRRMIERIDGEVIGHIIRNLKNTTIVLTADHSTPVNLREHSADPTPVAIYGGVRTDLVNFFTEEIVPVETLEGYVD